jgi:hypothetical protein
MGAARPQVSDGLLARYDAAQGLCQSNARLRAGGATSPLARAIYAASARHSASAAERLCL